MDAIHELGHMAITMPNVLVNNDPLWSTYDGNWFMFFALGENYKSGDIASWRPIAFGKHYEVMQSLVMRSMHCETGVIQFRERTISPEQYIATIREALVRPYTMAHYLSSFHGGEKVRVGLESRGYIPNDFHMKIINYIRQGNRNYAFQRVGRADDRVKYHYGDLNLTDPDDVAFLINNRRTLCDKEMRLVKLFADPAATHLELMRLCAKAANG